MTITLISDAGEGFHLPADLEALLKGAVCDRLASSVEEFVREVFARNLTGAGE